MIYTVEKAELITEQLRRFNDGYAHHVAGQFANIDFWMEEVRFSITAIDDYNKRFNKMRDAQKSWIEAHGTLVYDYCPICGGKCELSNGYPAPPIRMPDNELKDVRKKLIDIAYLYLLRGYRMQLLTESDLIAKCQLIGTSLDPTDISR